ncbi:hypothetical protein TYRP_023535 [Tyrophagus putrescentiae]|nr:hypothetical protein TYRP_023535 [Tyrophagus putrescentiae]
MLEVVVVALLDGGHLLVIDEEDAPVEDGAGNFVLGDGLVGLHAVEDPPIALAVVLFRSVKV